MEIEPWPVSQSAMTPIYRFKAGVLGDNYWIRTCTLCTFLVLSQAGVHISRGVTGHEKPFLDGCLSRSDVLKFSALSWAVLTCETGCIL